MANYGAISDKNKNRLTNLILNEVSDAFAIKTPSAWSGTAGTSINLGQIADSSVSQSTNKTEIKNEAGYVVNTDYDYSLMTNATIMERDKTKIDFLADWVKGKYYLEYKYLGIVDGKHSEIFKFVQVTPQFNVTLPGGATSIKYESTAVFPDSTITITSTSLAAIETALSVTIYCTKVTVSPSKGYCLIETAVS